MPSIEDAQALFGESVAQLRHYTGGDPGYHNVLEDRTRAAARAYGLAVLEEAFKSEFVQITTASDAHRLALRAHIEALK